MRRRTGGLKGRGFNKSSHFGFGSRSKSTAFRPVIRSEKGQNNERGDGKEEEVYV